MNRENYCKNNHRYFSMILLVAMRVDVSQQGNVVFHSLQFLGDILDFHALNYVLKYTIVYFFYYCAVKIEH